MYLDVVGPGWASVWIGGAVLYGLSVNNVIWLLLIAALVAVVAQRLRLPYTVGLVITGLVLAVVHLTYGVTLTRSLVFNVLLPPLLFEAALNIRWGELRREAWSVGLLSTVGVVISAFVVAVAMTLIASWPWQSAMVFGVLISATDPVSVIATFRQAGITGRLRLIVEAESLLNDGVAATLFAAALLIAGGGSAIHAIPFLLWTIAGGVVIGAICSALAVVIVGRATDPQVEITLTVLTAFGSFAIADHFHASGVLAVVTAGLVMGNVGIMDSGVRHFTSRGREAVVAVWDFGAFVANSLIFLLIGLRTAGTSFSTLGGIALVTAVVSVLLGRAATVYPLCWALRGTRQKLNPAFQHVLWWGGLRGALGLALALSLPASLPRRDAIEIATFVVVAVSILMQGITMPWFLKSVGVLAPGPARGK